MFGFLKRLLGSGSGQSSTKREPSAEREWFSWKADDYPPSAPEGFVKLSGTTDISVAGTSYRLDDCRTLLSALKGKRVDQEAILLIREENNPDHPNAIRVVAKLSHKEVHIGYLPRDINDMIAQKFSRDMPLKASLREWGKKKTDDAVFFRLTVFVPNAKERRKFGGK